MLARAERFQDLVESVSDGRPIDWTQAISRADSEADRAWLDDLRAVAMIGEAHRVGSGAKELGAPSVLGRYRLLEEIGRGGMGVVWRARDATLQRDVALKILPEHLAARTDSRARFLREARLAARLSHPNICVIYDVAETEEPPFVTMELLRGETLRARLRREGALSGQEALRIGREIALALAAAHGHGIVHRDIKPENVMLLADGRVKVLDFGLAKRVDSLDFGNCITPFGVSLASNLTTAEHVVTETLDRSDETITGTVMGTCSYMSPEQIEARPADSRSDIFSFGVVMYEMLAGRQPFQGETAAQVLAAILNRQPADLAASRPGIPAPLVTVTERCLSKAAEKRFAGGRELAAEFEKMDQEMKPPRASLRVSRPTRLVVIAAVIVTVAAGLKAMLTGIPMETATTAPRPAVRRLTSDGASFWPVFSPDGGTIAYRRSVKGVEQAFVMPVRGGPGRQLTHGPRRFVPLGWHPRGDTLIGYSEAELTGNIWEAPLVGGEPRLLIENGAYLDFHPDGTHVLFLRMAADLSNQHIVKDITTGEERVLHQASAKEEICIYARWSPDGKQLAFICAPGATGGRETHAYLVDPDTGRKDPLQVPAELGINSPPTWMPDGQGLIFSALSGHDSAIWLFPLDGTQRPRRLSAGLTNDADPSASPDGRFVAFNRGSTITTLMNVDTATGSMHETLRMSAHSESLDMVRQEGGVLFSQTLGDVSNIMWIPSSGGEPAAITQGENQSCDQLLSLDAGTVAFVCTKVREEAPGPTGNLAQTLWTADLQGGRRRKLLEITDSTLWLSAASTDGRLIFYGLAGEKGRTRYLLDTELGESRLLHLPASPLASATFTHDDRSLYLLQVRMAADNSRKVPSLLRLDLADGTLTEGGPFPADLISSARFSRGGDFIAYVTEHASDEARQQLWVWPSNGGQAPRLVLNHSEEGSLGRFAISDDGRTIVLMKRQESSDLYLMENY